MIMREQNQEWKSKGRWMDQNVNNTDDKNLIFHH